MINSFERTDRKYYFSSSSPRKISECLSVANIYRLIIDRIDEPILSNLLEAITPLPYLSIADLDVEFYQVPENDFLKIWSSPQIINHACFSNIEYLLPDVVFYVVEEPEKFIYALTLGKTTKFRYVTKVTCSFSTPCFWDDIFQLLSFVILESSEITIEHGVSGMALEHTTTAFSRLSWEEQLAVTIKFMTYSKNLKSIYIYYNSMNSLYDEVSYQELIQEPLKVAKIFVDGKFRD